MIDHHCHNGLLFGYLRWGILKPLPPSPQEVLTQEYVCCCHRTTRVEGWVTHFVGTQLLGKELMEKLEQQIYQGTLL